MFTLLIGILIVAGSAAGFGFALFGRRPIPQPAMQFAPTQLESSSPELSPSSSGTTVVATARIEEPIEGRRARDVTITPWVRCRSALLLGLTVIGIAAIVGAVLSVIVVGIVFIAT